MPTHRHRRTHRALGLTVGCALSMLVLAAAVGQEPVPIGDQFRLNSIASAVFTPPGIGALPSGGFVVAWTAIDEDYWYTYTRTRRFDAAGQPVEADIEIATSIHFHGSFLTDFHPTPKPDGGFVVVYERVDTYYGEHRITSREVDAGGTPGPFHGIGTYTFPYFVHSHPDVDRGGDGDLIVVWDVIGEVVGEIDMHGILGRRLAGDSSPLDDQFLINVTTSGDQKNPGVAKDPDDGFLVVWDSPDGGGSGIFGRRFDADGTALTGELPINAQIVSSQIRPVITSLGGDGFAVVWEDAGRDGSGLGLFGRRLAVDGSPLGDDFPINQTTLLNQSQAVMTATGSGFAVAWTDGGGADGDGEGVFLRHFDPTGAPIGGEVQVNQSIVGNQRIPSIAATGPAEITVVWQSKLGVASFQVFGRRFAVPLFSDGFEGGGTSRWSSTVP